MTPDIFVNSQDVRQFRQTLPKADALLKKGSIGIDNVDPQSGSSLEGSGIEVRPVTYRVSITAPAERAIVEAGQLDQWVRQMKERLTDAEMAFAPRQVEGERVVDFTSDLDTKKSTFFVDFSDKDQAATLAALMQEYQKAGHAAEAGRGAA